MDKLVIMPNHVHLIIAKQTGGYGDPLLHVYDVIGNFKSDTAHEYGKALWQRSFHDPIIRGERDPLKIWDCMDTAPRSWSEDCFCTSQGRK